jgi:hypothetical protein
MMRRLAVAAGLRNLVRRNRQSALAATRATVAQFLAALPHLSACTLARGGGRRSPSRSPV